MLGRAQVVGLLREEGYGLDWATALVIITINWAFPVNIFHATDRFLSPADSTLDYPFVSSTVSEPVLYLIALIIPATYFAIVQLVHRSPTFVRDVHHGWLSLAQGYALVSTKRWWAVYLGRYRPDFHARLALYNAGKIDLATLDNGRLAYPSGHAAIAVMGLGLVSLHLIGKLRIFASSVPARSRPFPGRLHFPLLIISLIPLYVAVFVALSRAHDYKHDFSDINAGIMLGACTCIVAYALNFHGVSTQLSGTPRMRTDHSDANEEEVSLNRPLITEVQVDPESTPPPATGSAV